MATYTKTGDFTVNKMDSLITQLENARSAYADEEQAAVCAGFIFTALGIAGGPGGVIVTASILTGALAAYFDTIQDAITKTISVLEDYKDFLQSNSNYDKARLEVTYQSSKVNNVTYIYPIDFNFIAVHSINPPGWIY